MRFSFAVLTFLASSFYVLLLDHSASSSRTLQKALVVIILIILILIYRFSRHSWKDLASKENRFFLIFWGTILVQLLILSTGGLQSPFLVLLHFFMISLIFFFSFSLSLLFLFSCLLVLFFDAFFAHTLQLVFIENPNTILTLVSFMSIVPLAYILSQQYHAKDVLFGLLRAKAATDDAIFSTLRELIIVTDEKLRILSMNDAAVRTLQQSRSELLDKPLFDALLLRDYENKLVTAQTFFPEGTALAPKKIAEHFTLIKSPVPQRSVTVQVQLVKNAGKNNNQISFVISFTHTAENILAVTVDKARARYEALLQNIKKQSEPEGLKTDIMLLEKVEQDTYVLQALKATGQKLTNSRIDVAQLCKQIVLYNQDFATAFRVTTQFNLPNFGKDDIAPLTVENYPVNPEQLTGPFFTIACDAKQLEIALRKLFDLGILLSSTETNPHVTLAVERTEEEITITLCATSTHLTKEDLPSLFIPYYGRLIEKTNLHNGSGIEGFLVKQITDNLEIPLKTAYDMVDKTLTIALTLKKRRS